MSEKTTKPRLFEVKEYSAKILASLSNLEKSQQPGEHSGKATKTVVLEVAKNAIKDMLEKGYTAKQIADALSSDVFGILPKTITQMMTTKSTTKKTKPASTSDAKKQASIANTKKQATSTAVPASATFKIKPDTDDL